METQIKKSKKPIILGILSLVLWIIPIVGAPISIIGIVISLKNLKKDKCKAFKLGLALNILGLILSILCYAFTYYFIINNII